MHVQPVSDTSSATVSLVEWSRVPREEGGPLLTGDGGTAPRERPVQTCGTPESSPVAHTPLASPHHHIEPEPAIESI